MWYHSFNEFAKQEYGMKLYKLALDAGRTGAAEAGAASFAAETAPGILQRISDWA